MCIFIHAESKGVGEAMPLIREAWLDPWLLPLGPYLDGASAL
mgnify:CR=1 FL=1